MTILCPFCNHRLVRDAAQNIERYYCENEKCLCEDLGATLYKTSMPLAWIEGKRRRIELKRK